MRYFNSKFYLFPRSTYTFDAQHLTDTHWNNLKRAAGLPHEDMSPSSLDILFSGKVSNNTFTLQNFHVVRQSLLKCSGVIESSSKTGYLRISSTITAKIVLVLPLVFTLLGSYKEFHSGSNPDLWNTIPFLFIYSLIGFIIISVWLPFNHTEAVFKNNLCKVLEIKELTQVE